MHHIRVWARTKAYGPSIHFPGKSEKASSLSGAQSTNMPTVITVPPVENITKNQKAVVNINIFTRILLICKSIIFASYLNVLLIFVPAGIAVKIANLDPRIVFGVNATAIIPLAGLLSHATESVAQRMGDTVGALMNVTFGNAVELIILYAFSSLNRAWLTSKDEIRIVQASLLGSILANLLLILGMCFLVGGLRYLEQLYNSKVTQLSACLLSLSVMSLLLPTAFHASFSDLQEAKAESAVLKVSRGTSVVLLLVYGMYLLFQLKSHSYMYKSTPQHIIDEEAIPGPVAAWMEQNGVNHSPSGSDSDVSHKTHFTTTTRRVKKAIRRRSSRRQSSTGSSTLLESLQSPLQKKPSLNSLNLSPHDRGSTSNILTTNTETNKEDDQKPPSPSNRRVSIIDPENNHRRSQIRANREGSRRKPSYSTSKNVNNTSNDLRKANFENAIQEKEPKSQSRVSSSPLNTETLNAKNLIEENLESKRPFNLRIITFPLIPKSLSQNIFTQPHFEPNGLKTEVVPNIRYGVRRTSSLPNNLYVPHHGCARGFLPADQIPINFNSTGTATPHEIEEHENISRTTSVFLLLISTSLVALCAEFMVGSIGDVVKNDSGLSEAFIGLIILPIVGNAAEHVTAVTVAAKNKMDLAIGVAIGSSIQIALFVTPFVVLLGWCMGKELSLLFTLFETVSLFVSAFIVNFLVLDGRSNYLEGALLCAAYIMIAVAAFFYPSVQESSSLGGNDASPMMMKRALELIAILD
ncbi:putative vacuolar calcium ion transporter protein [Erysiphe neolycopersici]|uniref:Putative vacuolar calcium ion transporter protein n=1 Tax=Erysiphe neolycopersici TaxID=212602 RepID=A0A420H9U8_9PEZI|nr:putative vacuolar calcium ion transporter protein [Erysiphe neolycopersici]